MSMLFSGFATRQQQQLYDNLIEQLIGVLCKRVSKIYDGSQCNEHAFKMVLLKIMVNVNLLEEKKYQTPKLSYQAKDLMQLLQLDYLATSSSIVNNQNGQKKKKEYHLFNQSDLVSKKAHLIANKQRSFTPMNGANLGRMNQKKEGNTFYQQNKVNSANNNYNSQGENSMNEGIIQKILPQNSVSGEKNGFRVKLMNKNEEFGYGPSYKLKQGNKEEDTSSKNTISSTQNYDISKDISINSKQQTSSSFVNCYESINVKKNNHFQPNQEFQAEENNSIYQSHQVDGNLPYYQPSNYITSLSPPPANNSHFQNSFDVLLERIQDQAPSITSKIDYNHSNYATFSSQKGQIINNDLDCPMPSHNFPQEQPSINSNIFNNHANDNVNKSSLIEPKDQTMIDLEIIKKIINIAPQMGKLNKQERSIDKQFRRLRKKSQQPNSSVSNQSSVNDGRNDFDIDVDKFEQEYYYGNFVSSTTSAGSHKFVDSTRANRKNGFFSVQRNNK